MVVKRTTDMSPKGEESCFPLIFWPWGDTVQIICTGKPKWGVCSLLNSHQMIFIYIYSDYFFQKGLIRNNIDHKIIKSSSQLAYASHLLFLGMGPVDQRGKNTFFFPPKCSTEKKGQVNSWQRCECWVWVLA